MIDATIFPVITYLLVFTVAFSLFWLSIIWLIAQLSGWRQLAEVYPERPLQFPTCWKWQSIVLRWGSSYSGVLTVCADENGVTIVPMWLFRIGHAPLTIPWEDITVIKNSYSVKLQLQQMPTLSVKISPKLATKWVDLTNGRFSDQPIIPL